MEDVNNESGFYEKSPLLNSLSKKKRAVIFASGGLTGAYGAGFAEVLCKTLGNNFFSEVYGFSVGAYTAALYVLNLPCLLSDIWRNHVDGKKFVNLWNVLVPGKNGLRLDYLIGLFEQDVLSRLERGYAELLPRLTFGLTEYQTGLSTYITPRAHTLLNALQASSCIPGMFKPVLVDGVAYVDGGLSCALPIERALKTCDEVWVILNRSRAKTFYSLPKRMLAAGFTNALRLLHPLQRLKCDKKFEISEEALLKNFKNYKRVKIFRPSQSSALEWFLDTDKKRLNATVDLGIADAKDFLQKLGFSSTRDLIFP